MHICDPQTVPSQDQMSTYVEAIGESTADIKTKNMRFDWDKADERRFTKQIAALCIHLEVEPDQLRVKGETSPRYRVKHRLRRWKWAVMTGQCNPGSDYSIHGSVIVDGTPYFIFRKDLKGEY